jgi:hypothetical protein
LLHNFTLRALQIWRQVLVQVATSLRRKNHKMALGTNKVI